MPDEVQALQQRRPLKAARRAHSLRIWRKILGEQHIQQQAALMLQSFQVLGKFFRSEKLNWRAEHIGGLEIFFDRSNKLDSAAALLAQLFRRELNIKIFCPGQAHLRSAHDCHLAALGIHHDEIDRGPIRRKCPIELVQPYRDLSIRGCDPAVARVDAVFGELDFSGSTP